MTTERTDSTGQAPDRPSAFSRRYSRALAIEALLFVPAALGALKVGWRISDAVVLWYVYGSERAAREHLRVVSWHQRLLVSNGDELGALLWAYHGITILVSFTILGLALAASPRLLPREFLRLIRSESACRSERRFPWLMALAFFGTAIPLMVFTSLLWPHLVVLAAGVAAAWMLFRGDEGQNSI